MSWSTTVVETEKNRSRSASSDTPLYIARIAEASDGRTVLILTIPASVSSASTSRSNDCMVTAPSSGHSTLGVRGGGSQRPGSRGCGSMVPSGKCNQNRLPQRHYTRPAATEVGEGRCNRLRNAAEYDGGAANPAACHQARQRNKRQTCRREVRQ